MQKNSKSNTLRWQALPICSSVHTQFYTTNSSLPNEQINGRGKLCHSESKKKKDERNLHNKFSYSSVCMLTAATSLLGMLGRTPTRDGCFTPQCVELRAVSSFIHCYTSITLDTHPDKKSLGCAVLPTNTSRKRSETSCPYSSTQDNAKVRLSKQSN
jgi:hypothetical protein